MNWNELLERYDVANRGVGGDITSGLVDRLKFVTSLKPKICFIEGGINDLQRDIDTIEICSNITAVIDSLKQHSIVPVLTMVIYVNEDYTGSTSLNKKVELLNQSYKAIAVREHIETIDLNDNLCCHKLLKSELAEEDGVHLKSAAYLSWKKSVQEILTKLKI